MSRSLAAACALIAAGIGLAALAPPRRRLRRDRICRGARRHALPHRPALPQQRRRHRPGERDRQSEPDPGRPAAGHSGQRIASAVRCRRRPRRAAREAAGAYAVRARRHALFAGAPVAGQPARLARRQSRRRSRAGSRSATLDPRCPAAPRPAGRARCDRREREARDTAARPRGRWQESSRSPDADGEFEDHPARPDRACEHPSARAWAGSRPSGPYICRRGRHS